jgi:ABC-type transport system involved in multi-copper enzyme maturation permease subunit
MLVGLVAFFYWSLNIRPWDKQVRVVVYDEGHSGLVVEKARLEDGSELVFHEVASLQEVKDALVRRDLGLVILADFDRDPGAGGEPGLQGYVLWSQRHEVDALEAKYSQQFTELFGRPVRVHIGENVVVPPADGLGTASSAAFYVFLAVFYVALTVLPHLMFEERRSRTMDALLVSPASAGQVVLGKALAGVFYMLLSGGLALALNWAYVTHWGLALLAFSCSVLFSIGLALALGSLVQSPQQLALWSQPIVFLLLVPSFFAQEPNLAANLKTAIAYLPTTALTKVFGFALSSGASPAQLWTNLAIALGWTGLVYAVVVWQVRRSDR